MRRLHCSSWTNTTRVFSAFDRRREPQALPLFAKHEQQALPNV
ncbi:MAG: hypothetical protein RMA76_13775 [Deltaproteobacteria bacterium]